MNPKTRFNLLYLLIAFSGVLLVHDLWIRSQAVAVIPYSQFQQLLSQGKVKEVVVDADSIQGLKEPLQGEPYQGRSHFLTTQVRPDLAATLEKYGVTFAGRVENPWLHTILSWLVPVFLFGALWMWFARRVGGPGGPGAGLMSIGKSSWVRQAPARRSSRGQSRGRQPCPSFPSADPNSSRCSSAWERRASATSSSRHGSSLRDLRR